MQACTLTEEYIRSPSQKAVSHRSANKQPVHGNRNKPAPPARAAPRLSPRPGRVPQAHGAHATALSAATASLPRSQVTHGPSRGLPNSLLRLRSHLAAPGQAPRRSRRHPCCGPAGDRHPGCPHRARSRRPPPPWPTGLRRIRWDGAARGGPARPGSRALSLRCGVAWAPPLPAALRDPAPGQPPPPRARRPDPYILLRHPTPRRAARPPLPTPRPHRSGAGIGRAAAGRLCGRRRLAEPGRQRLPPRERVSLAVSMAPPATEQRRA